MVNCDENFSLNFHYKNLFLEIDQLLHFCNPQNINQDHKSISTFVFEWNFSSEYLLHWELKKCFMKTRWCFKVHFSMYEISRIYWVLYITIYIKVNLDLLALRKRTANICPVSCIITLLPATSLPIFIYHHCIASSFIKVLYLDFLC